jgi:hypothetical protein
MAVATVMIVVAALMPLVLAGVFFLIRCRQRWRPGESEAMSPVARQHFDIFQNGEFNEAALEQVKRRFLALFEEGSENRVEASVRPGTQFIIQVRALAEIGTEAAGRILERQLHRRLSDNYLEQSWYWIDLAACLRVMQREESLPHLLRCSAEARESPLGHYFAGETACFLGFAGYVRQPQTTLGRAALRLLHRAVEGLRHGVQPALIVEARLGEMIESAWDHRPTGNAPVHARIVHEALRLLRRAPHLKAFVGEESAAEQEALDWQFSRLASLEPAFRDFLKEVPDRLLAALVPGSSLRARGERETRGEELADLLLALNDLRVDAADALLPRVRRASCEHRGLMVDVLSWSRDSRVAAWMREFARAHVQMEKRGRYRLLAQAPRRPSIPTEIPYRNILRGLRRQPSVETERFLILASQDWDPTVRSAALSSLGWWEPMLTREVRECLTRSRRDPSAEVRQVARAALARLGERASVHWFRQALLADDPHQVAEAAHVIANEGLTLLWPDLDRLLDHDHADVALHGREAVERLAEEMEQSRSCSL